MSEVEEQVQIQQPLPFAYVNGEAVVEKPEDLYIPPEALEVVLESFEGPLDLLLYLIRKNKFDIVDMPILKITEQYMEYVEVMKEIKLELAGEYLVMAAILAEIKSRLLLPKRIDEDGEEIDPRAELIRRLQEYEIIKHAAENLDEIPRMERDIHLGVAEIPDDCEPVKILPDVSMQDLLSALAQVMKRADAFTHHHVERESLSTRERMSIVLDKLNNQSFIEFAELFTAEEGRQGVVVTFLAILELVKESLIEIVQAQAYGNIHVKRREQIL